MRQSIWRRMMSIMLIMIMILTSFPLQALAEETTPTVKIVSFNRGPQDDLRSSELLEARVTGYNGNVQDLTYEWTNGLGTHLYVYNTHNMYFVSPNEFTDREVEIYPSGESGSANMEGRSYRETFAGKGYAWASVYGGSNSTGYALNGTITVKVRDANGNLIGTDTHTGTVSRRGWSYQYSGILPHDLEEDLKNITIGLFEGDRRNVKDLLGEAAIVHIICSASSVTNGNIIAGDEHIDLTYSYSEGNYYITGVNAGTATKNGDAKVNITVSKSSCKFHKNTSGTATTSVYVFKKPNTATTATTLILTGSLDNRCKYFIDGVEGTKQDDGTILFTGLTPNTEYEVTVRAEYKDGNNDTQYVYAYVYDTTKPAYNVTVNTYLDNISTDMTNITGTNALYIKERAGQAGFISLAHTGTGVYTTSGNITGVSNGTYYAYTDDSDGSRIGNIQTVVDNNNVSMDIRYYSVRYNTAGGSFNLGEDPGTVKVLANDDVVATANVPQKDGYAFMGWQWQATGNTYDSGAKVTDAIDRAIVLNAQWEKTVRAKINVTIDHTGGNGYDPEDNKDELTVYLLEKKSGSDLYLETGESIDFKQEGVTGYTVTQTWIDGEANKTNEHARTTVYTANDFIYTDLLSSSAFTALTSKTNYDVKSVEALQDSDGNWIIDVRLKFQPNNKDIEFSVAMEGGVPKEVWPKAVIAKVTFWNDQSQQWELITQQEGNLPGVRLDLDVSGKASGTYPVWSIDASTNKSYGYRFMIASYVYDDGQGGENIVAATETTKNQVYEDGNLIGTVDETKMVVLSAVVEADLKGAYFEGDTQEGKLHAVISAQQYDVTFNAQGGKVKEQDKYTVPDQYFVPAFSGYEPVMEGHTFLGWYLEKDCINPATEGALLRENITLYAKWDKTLTGTVILAGTYLQDGHTVEVWESDRATSAIVVLKDITTNVPQTVNQQSVTITWDAETDLGTSSQYKFTGLNPDKKYRIEVLLTNYDDFYQNSETEVDSDGDIADDYNKTDYDAVYTASEPWETFVNGYMSFKPESFEVQLEVDATAIGSGFRPEDVLAQIWYKETGSTNEAKPISQHTVAPYGMQVTMDANGNSVGSYSYEVWKTLYNGKLYDYQAHVEKIDGDDAETWPVRLTYGSVSRWDPQTERPTNKLTAYIEPLTYDIIYDYNFKTDNPEENIVEYSNDGHKWSYKTEITYVPERDGYVFHGWYSDANCTAGNEVTEIAASVDEDTRLYAKWVIRNDLSLKVNFVNQDTNETIKPSVIKENLNFGTIFTAQAVREEIEGYTFVTGDPAEIVIGTGSNEITLYYTKDAYSYTVNYLEAGTGEVLKTADIVSKTRAETMLDETVFGQTFSQSPASISGYTHNKDYTTTSGLNGVSIDDDGNVSFKLKGDGGVINFYYSKRTDISMTVRHVDKDTSVVLREETVGGMTLGTQPKISTLIDTFTGYKFVNAYPDPMKIKGEDSENVLTLYYQKQEFGYTVEYYFNGDLDGNLTESGGAIYGTTVSKEVAFEKEHNSEKYIFDYAENNPLTITAEEAKNVIKVYYWLDADDNDVPDKYQATVTYKIVNGKWADDKDDPIVAKFITKTFNTQTKNWIDKDPQPTLDNTIPTGMKGNTGYDEQEGHWDETISNNTKVVDGSVYTFAFTEANSYIITASVTNGKVTVGGSEKTYYEGIVTHSDEDITTMTFKANEGYALDYVSVDGIAYNTDAILEWNRTSDSNGNHSIIFDHKKDHAIIVMYDVDENDDNIPDKYQKKVTFKVEHGTWDGTEADPIVKYVTLLKDGNWSASGSGILANSEIPKGMRPITGYTETGAWDTSKINEAIEGNTGVTLTGTATETYTYDFERSTITVKIEVVNGTSNPVPSVTTFYYDSTKYETITFVPYEGYALDSVTINNVNANITGHTGEYKHTHGFTQNLHIKVVYKEDKLDDGGDKTTGGDGIPDEYQRVVTYKIENGTWKEGGKADKTEVFTLKTKAANGTWADVTPTLEGTVPEGMKADTGYKAGKWDVTPTDETQVTGNKTYTYSYQLVEYIDYLYTVEHYKQQPDESYVIDNAATEHNTVKIELNVDKNGFESAATLPTLTAIAKNYGVHYSENKAHEDRIPTAVPVYGETGITLKLFYQLDKHTVEYDLNGGSAPAGTDYTKAEYICGVQVPVKDIPVLNGYIFEGWLGNDGNTYVTGNMLTVDKDIKLTAQWSIMNNIPYIVNYLEEGTGNVLSPQKVAYATFNDVIKSKAEIIDLSAKEYAFVRADKAQIVIGTTVTDNVINLFYALDKWDDNDIPGGSGDDSETGGDGIPDIYQALVKYQIENGTWKEGGKADKLEIFTLKTKDAETDEWTATNVTLGDTVPENMKPDTGFNAETGAWDVTPGAATKVTGNATYKYTYGAKLKYNIEVRVTNGTAAYGSDNGTNMTFSVEHGTDVKIDFAGNAGYALDTVKVKAGTADAAYTVLEADSSYTFEDVDKNYRIEVVYEKDVWNDETEEEDNGDGIPDKRQAKVTYKIENGTWSGGGKDDKVYIFTIQEKDGSGVWNDKNVTLGETVPAGMVPDTGYDASSGKWDVTPESTTKVTGDVTYIFTYGDKHKHTIDVQVVNGKATSGGEEFTEKTIIAEHGDDVSIKFTGTSGFALDIVKVTPGGSTEQIKNLDSDSKYSFNNIDRNYKIVVVYETDEWDDNDIPGGSGDDKTTGSDGIPDKYQALITYQIENGTWKEGGNADKLEIFTLKTKDADGNWNGVAPQPTLGETLPEGMVPDTGYSASSGAWNETITSDTPVTESKVYKYKYDSKIKYNIEVLVTNGDAFYNSGTVSNTKFSVDHGTDVNLIFSGKDKHVLDTVQVTAGTGAPQYTNLAPGSSYQFNDVAQDYKIVVVYEKDEWDDNDDNTTDGDGIPDIYQAMVTYQIENGTWNGTAGNNGPITEIFTMKTKDIDGTWKNVSPAPTLSGTIPTGMQPAEGYNKSTGNWKNDSDPTDTTAVVNGAVYTYSFAKKQYSITVEVVNGTATSGGADVTNTTITAEHGADVTIDFDANSGYALDTSVADGAYAALDESERYTFSNVTKNHTIRVVYELDKLDDNDDNTTDGDGIPDKYQKIVQYKIVNGTWDGTAGNDGPITEIFTIQTKNAETGEWTATGVTLGTTVPEGMKANPGYDKSPGTWTPEVPTSATAADKNGEYTYTFGLNQYNITVEVVNGTATSVGTDVTNETIQAAHGANVTIDFNGNADHILYTAEADGAAITLDADETYTFSNITGNHTIKVVYEKDVWDDEDDKETGGDGIPDKHQTKVTYQIVNGKWAGDSTADKIEIFTVQMKNDEGVWADTGVTLDGTIPTGMQANDGFKSGMWNPVPTAETVVPHAGATYIYKYLATKFVDYQYTVEHYKQQPDGTYAIDVPSTEIIGVALELNTAEDGFEGVNPTFTAVEKTFEGHYTENTTHTDRHASETLEFGTTLKPIVLKLYYQLDSHKVTYNLNGGTGVSGVDYSAKTYLCGNKTTMLEAPELSGFDFKGWLGNDGVTYPVGKEITVDRDLALTAQWTAKTGIAYTVNYLDEDTLQPVKAQKTGAGTFGQVITSEAERTAAGDIDGYCYTGASHETLTIGSEVDKNVLNLYYSADQWHDSDPDGDGNPDVPGDVDNETEGDGIPDKYQAKVTYQIEGGSWDANDKADRTEIFTVKLKDASGNWNDTNVTLGTTIPDTTAAKPDSSHSSMSYWEPVPYVNERVKAGETIYVYKFDSLVTGLKATFDANGGSWAADVTDYTMVTDTEGSRIAAEKLYTFGAKVDKISQEPVREGHTFIGWYTKDINGDLTAPRWTTYIVEVGGVKEERVFEELIYEDTTYYAKWEEVTVPGPGPTPDKGTLYINLQDDGGAAIADLVTIEITDGNYKVASEAGADVDYVIPQKVTGYDGRTYIYEGVAAGSAGVENNQMGSGEFAIVTLQYTVDQWHDSDTDGDGTPDVPGDVDNETGGDGIPDKYQARVIYQIDGGSWDAAGTDKADRLEIFTLKVKDSSTGVWSDIAPVPQLGNTIPDTSAAMPDADHEAPAAWDTEPKADTTVQAGTTVYIYAFTDKTTGGGTITPPGGTPDEDIFYDADVTPDPNDKDSENRDPENTNPDPDGDGIPDMYQAVIKFRIVNGTWAGGTSEEIVQVGTLYEPGTTVVNVTGTGMIVIPTGMTANDGYEPAGSWDVDPGDGTITAADHGKVYTYTFTATTPPPEPVIPMDVVSLVVNKKVINTGEADISPEGFEFVLEEVGTGIKTVKTTSSSGFAFFTLSYLEDDGGVYNYKLYEVDGGADNILYDDTVRDIKIDVAIKYGWPEATVYIDGVLIEESFIMLDAVNVETSGITGITIPVWLEKAVNNVDGADAGPEEFKAVCENITTGEKNVYSFDTAGEGGFTLAYGLEDAGKTYTYKIYELNEGREDVEYDDTVYELTVAVSLDAAYKIKADVLFNGAEEDEYVAKFVNTVNGAGGIGGGSEGDPEGGIGSGEEGEAEGGFEEENAEVPKTGDDLMVRLWMYLMMMQASLAAMIALGIRKKNYK